MKIKDIMTPSAHIASPDQSLREIAQIMAEEDIGFMPVGENDRLVGTITDRDMAIRGYADGMDGTYLVRDVMTREVKYCYADDNTEDVLKNMGDLKVRRLPVLDAEKRLIGVISLGDIASKDSAELTATTIRRVVQPGGLHSQIGDTLH